MPAAHFKWHPDARVFVAGQRIRQQRQHTSPTIRAKPAAQALDGILNSMGAHPFCVSDTDNIDLTALTSLQFATLTGGTSGAPKVIARTQASWISSFEINAAQFCYTAQDSIAVLGSLAHSLSLYGVLEALHLGLDLHVLGGLGPAAQTAQLRAQSCRILYATPTQLRLLPATAPLNDVRLILCGGGAMTADTRAHIKALCPNARLHLFYGAAETSFVTLSDETTPEGSVGRAYAGVDIALRDTNARGTGTIWVRSPYLFDGYLQGDSQHTRREGDWLTVGELGRIDSQGYLYIQGRAGRVINIADQTVYPEALEAHISAATQLPYCAVMTQADDLRGRKLLAILPGVRDPELIRLVKDSCRTAGLHVPRHIVFLAPFPLLPSGKPDLGEIAKQTEAHL